MKLKKVFITLVIIYSIIWATDSDDKIYTQFLDLKNRYSSISKGLQLDKYKVIIEAKRIKEIKKNLSGITYSKKTDTLFAITNSPREIFELTKNGDVLRKIDLKGFKDTEGITYMEDDSFALIDERKDKLFIIKIDKHTRKIDARNLDKTFTFKIKSYKNYGYEGVAYDKANRDFFIVNEKFPIKIIKISNWLDRNKLKISQSEDLTFFDNFMDDFSGLHFDDKTKNLIFLSDESKTAAEVSLKGEQISFMDLERGFLGLKKDIPQPEGITVDSDGIIYIVSEPNLFYSFKK